MPLLAARSTGAGRVTAGLLPEYLCRTHLVEMHRMSKRRSRRGERLPEPASLIVRGDLLDPEALREDAADNFEVYGYYGISVFAEVNGFNVDQIAAAKLTRARWLVLFSAGDVLAAGLELWDTGQSPHYDVVHDDVEELVERLVACPHRIIPNPAGPRGGRL